MATKPTLTPPPGEKPSKYGSDPAQFDAAMQATLDWLHDHWYTDQQSATDFANDSVSAVAGAAVSAQTATTKATEAAASAATAANSATSAAGSATTAGTKATEAAASATAAAGSATTANTKAADAATSATSASASATAAAGSATTASTKAADAANSATAAAGSATTAATKATEAAASAASAINAPGTSATSTTSLTVGTGTKTMTIQAGKAFAVGQFVVIASTVTPSNYMVGQITAHNNSTGALTVEASTAGGAGTFANWSVALTGPVAVGGPAGGVLAGSYPNPTFAVDIATQAELDAHTGDNNNPHGTTAAQVGADSAGTAAAAIAAHEAATDPHPQYTTTSEAAAAAPVQSVAGKTGAVTLAKGDVGLGNVDNTSDANKSVLSATKLTTARAIAGTSFDGQADIDISYTALTNKPTLGAAASKNVPSTGNAATTEVVLGSDSRLSDARTPTAHSHAVSDVTGLQGALDGKSSTSHTHANATTSVAGFMSSTDKSKLDGVATGATANAPDAQLRDRSTHTGSQAISTITGLQAALDAKQSGLSNMLVFTASGSWTVPAGVTKAKITLQAAGGGGCESSGCGGGCVIALVALTTGDVLSFSLGAASAGSTTANVPSASNSVLTGSGISLTALGGAGGFLSYSSVNISGGNASASGVNVIGSLVIPGGAGNSGMLSSGGAYLYYLSGGGSFLGTQGGGQGAAGSAGYGYGGNSRSAGGPPCLIVEY